MKTVVDLVTTLKTYFIGKDTTAKQAVENTIATVETDATSASKGYSVGEQLYLEDILYDVTASITAGDPLTVGTNIAVAPKLAASVSGKQDQIEVTTMPTASAAYVNKVLIYIGATTATYTSGQSYQCVYDSGSYSWIPVSGGTVTAANVSYDNTSSGMTADDVQEAVDELNTALANKVDTSNIANNLTTSNAGKVLDARQGKTLNNTKADQSLLAPIQATLIASKAYTIGEQFVYQGVLYEATAPITQGGTITIGGNCSLSEDVTTQIENISKTKTVSITNSTSNLNTFYGNVRNKVVTIRVTTNSVTANQWNSLGTLQSCSPESIVTCLAILTNGANNVALVNVETTGEIKILPSIAGTYVFGVTFICK